jgi:hypothetical protein
MIAIGICFISALLIVVILHLRKSNQIAMDSWIYLDNIRGEISDTKDAIIETKKELANVWVIAANVTGALRDLQESVDTYRKDFKLTFDDKFAKQVQEIVGIGAPVRKTMQVIADDGKPHIVPIDEGY